MFDSIIAFFKNAKKSEKNTNSSKDAAKERLHLYWVKERYNKTLQISRFLQEIQEEKKDR